MSSGRGSDRLCKAVYDLTLGSSEDGGWEAVSLKPKNKGGRNGGTPWPQQTSAAKAWGQPDTAKRLGMSSNNVPDSARNAPSNNPSKGSWGMRPHQGNQITGHSDQGRNPAPKVVSSPAVVEEWFVDEEKKVSDGDDVDDDEDVYSEEDDDMLSDPYDSDEIPSHETKKQHRMLKSFFDVVDKLTVDEVSDSTRQWHCPACKGGPGEINWYKGLQSLVTHARTKGSVRMKLHRMFADLLDEEIRRKGISLVPAGQAFGQWEGLQKPDDDRQIVWPPMVMIMNTRLELDVNEKWLGMGNQELVSYFKGDYDAISKACHSYGPEGHRGIGVLIFEGTAMGYWSAENLHKDFVKQDIGRISWERNWRVLLYQGGKRQLYGFLATRRDLEDFNRHCEAKSRVKYDMRSYKEKVVDQMKQMKEDNEQLTWYKSKVAKEQGRVKVLEESFNGASDKLRNTVKETRIVRQRITMQHEQNKEEMDFQEQFFNDQIQKIHDATNAKEQGRVKVLEESFKVASDKLRNTVEETRIVRQRATMQHEQNKEEMDFQEQFFNDQIQKIHDATNAKEQGRVKVLEESFNVVSDKLRNTVEETRIVRQRTTMQHEQNKEEMDFQEQFFNDQIQKIHDATNAKENKFEKLQQEELKKVAESKAQPSRMDDLRQRAEKVSKFKQFQEQEMEKFVVEKEEVICAHEAKKMEMKKKLWEEELQLERDFDAELTKLMEKYAPGPIEGCIAGDRA